MGDFLNSRFQININPRNWQAKEMLIFLFVVLFIGGSLAYIVSSPSSKSPQQKTPAPTPSSPPPSLSSEMVIYGVWSTNNSLIKALDIKTGKKYLLASLPKNIKQVKILSPTELLFVNKTNQKYRGKEIVVYNLETKTFTQVFSPDTGFEIESYSLSPNKRYLVVWETKPKGESIRISDGQSRVYSANLLNPKEKYLIEDEDPAQTQYIHVPLAITDSGKVFLDKFLPNCWTNCWAYGMRVSDFTGKQKEDLTNMQNGTYAPLPFLSPDGKYISFPGYDGNLGPGTDIKNNVRVGASNPNTVDLLDTSTHQRRRLPNIPNDRIYADAYWDARTSDNLVLVTITRDRKTVELYWYNLPSETIEKINSERLDVTIDLIFSSLQDNALLISTQNRSPSTMGNLDCHGHAFMYTSLSMLNQDTGSITSFTISDPFIQLIDIAPSSYFQNLEEISSGKKVLQLETFPLKPDIVPNLLEKLTIPEIPLKIPLIENPVQSLMDTLSFQGCTSCCSGATDEYTISAYIESLGL